MEVTARIVDIGGRRLCLTVSHSIAAHKELEEFLRGLTDVDELTGLLNRRGFFVKVDEMRRRARRGDRQVLLMYFDVDGLKRVNDERGHADGDKLLVAAADVLRVAFRERDVVARLGGDEFVAMALLGRRHDEQLDRQAIEARLRTPCAPSARSSATTTTSRSASAPWWPTTRSSRRSTSCWRAPTSACTASSALAAANRSRCCARRLTPPGAPESARRRLGAAAGVG